MGGTRWKIFFNQQGRCRQFGKYSGEGGGKDYKDKDVSGESQVTWRSALKRGSRRLRKSRTRCDVDKGGGEVQMETEDDVSGVFVLR